MSLFEDLPSLTWEEWALATAIVIIELVLLTGLVTYLWNRSLRKKNEG